MPRLRHGMTTYVESVVLALLEGVLLAEWLSG